MVYLFMRARTWQVSCVRASLDSSASRCSDNLSAFSSWSWRSRNIHLRALLVTANCVMLPASRLMCSDRIDALSAAVSRRSCTNQTASCTQFLTRSTHSTEISHAGTVVPECFKDDNASQWKSGKFDPRSLKNPRTDRHLNLHG